MAPFVAAGVLLLLAGSSLCLLLPEPLQTRPLFSGRAQQTVCVDIPRNLSLCHGVGYTTMRLPNLLEHDTMEEVAQQSGAWIPLMHIGCHVDARLFLCSLFSPVCLERDIWPCRSLCRTVQRGCEGRMLVHGYPWPDIFRCDRFPVDNDMCIPSQNPDPESAAEAAAAIAAATAAQNTADTAVENVASVDTVPTIFEAALQHRSGRKRGVCSQSSTFESVAEHLCRAEIAIRARVGHSRTLGNAELMKGPRRQAQRQQSLMLLSRPMILDESCSGRLEPRRAYLIAGHATVKGGGGGRRLNPTIVVPWPAAAKAVKRVISAISNATNCTDGKTVFFVPPIKTKLSFPRHSGRGRKGTTTTTTTTTTPAQITTAAPTTTTTTPTPEPTTTTTPAPTTTVPTTPAPTTTVPTTTTAATTTPIPTTTPVPTTPVPTTTPLKTTTQAPTTTTTTTTPAPPTSTTTTPKPRQPPTSRPKFSDNIFRHRERPFLPSSREDLASGGQSEDVSVPRGRGKKKHRQGKKKKERRRKFGASTSTPPESRLLGPLSPTFSSDLSPQPIRRRGYN